MPLPEKDSNITDVVIRGYSSFLLALFSLVPALLIGYLYLFQSPSLLFEHHRFHETAISVSILASAFITYVTWRCYRYSGEIFLRWLTLGFLGFTLIYAPHGAFTSYAHENMWLFILYGPPSRIAMLTCFFVGLMHYGKPAEPPEQRKRGFYWWKWIIGFLLLDIAVAALALSPLSENALLRRGMESIALLLALSAIVVMLVRRIRSPLMTVYVISLASFAQASAAFILSRPWNHMWWLAHAIFAGGFFLLSYGVVQAFRSTRSFSTVYSQVELMEQLQRANNDLERLAATDPLTGACNRREFLARTASELARSRRSRSPLSILALDLDHFKSVNDRYGHQAGDEVLISFVAKVAQVLRPSDIIGRHGGEEFMILLPDTATAGACKAAERLRLNAEQLSVSVGSSTVGVTVSIGVAQFGVDGDTIEACMGVADARMYRAKQEGRNRVVV